MNMKKMLFVMFVCLVGFGFATLPGIGFDNMTCGDINVSGEYKVNSTSIFNITSSSGVSCINITVSNVLLNLNSTTINGATTNNHAAIYIYNNTPPGGTGLLTNITIVNGSVNNSFYGIYVTEAGNVSINNVTVYNNTNGGIFMVSILTSSINNSIFHTGYSTTDMIWIRGGTNITVFNNTIYNFTLQGIVTQLTTSTSNHLISDNKIYNFSGNEAYGIYLSGCDGCRVIANNISNSTNGVAVYLDGVSNISQFSNNIIINATTGIKLIGASNLTFSGNNIINQTPVGGVIFNISNGILSTNGYNITTEYLPFALATTYNVSIQVVNLSGTYLGITSTANTVSPILGLSITSAKVVQSLWSNYYGLNVTSEGSGASISPRLYYLTSNVGAHPDKALGIYASNIWAPAVATVNSALSSASGTTDIMGYFAVLAYTPWSNPETTGDSMNYITLSTDFDCETGLLTVELSSAVNGATVKLLDKTSPFQDPQYATVSGGKAVFTITESGTYKITEGDFPSNYGMDDEIETYTLCLATEEEEQPQVECTTNSVCSTTEQCIANECVAVTGTCGYAASHAWVSYECCADSDCTEGFECTNYVCTEALVSDYVDEILVQAAIDAIADATSAIETAKSEGKDTVDAEAKLAEAQATFDSGNYDLAESLAQDSIELIKEPQAEETPEETLDETTTEDSKEEKGADYSMVLYLVGAVIVLFLLYKFVLKGGKGYRK